MTSLICSSYGRHGKPNRARPRGFTLIELMVVIAILAIVVTMAAPSFTALLDKRRLASATADVLNMVNQGRSQAITLNRSVVADVRSGDDGWCVGITDKAACDCTAAEGSGDACTLDLPPGAANAESLIRPVVNSVKHPGVTLAVPVGTTISYRASNGLLVNPVAQTLTTTSASSSRSMRVNVSAIGRANACGVNETFPGGVPQC